MCKKLDESKEKIKGLRKAAGLTQKEFAKYFQIPQRTLEQWEAGRAEPADYLIKLMEYKLRSEGIISGKKKNQE